MDVKFKAFYVGYNVVYIIFLIHDDVIDQSNNLRVLGFSSPKRPKSFICM